MHIAYNRAYREVQGGSEILRFQHSQLGTSLARISGTTLGFGAFDLHTEHGGASENRYRNFGNFYVGLNSVAHNDQAQRSGGVDGSAAADSESVPELETSKKGRSRNCDEKRLNTLRSSAWNTWNTEAPELQIS